MYVCVCVFECVSVLPLTFPTFLTLGISLLASVQSEDLDGRYSGKRVLPVEALSYSVGLRRMDSLQAPLWDHATEAKPGRYLPGKTLQRVFHFFSFVQLERCFCARVFFEQWREHNSQKHIELLPAQVQDLHVGPVLRGIDVDSDDDSLAPCLVNLS